MRFLLLFLPILAVFGDKDLCEHHSCTCQPNAQLPDLQDVVCMCSNLESFKIGIGESNSYGIPSSCAQLRIEGCGDVDLLQRSFNAAGYLKNATFEKLQRLTVHSKLYEARSGNGGLSMNVNNIELSTIRHLDVHRHAFEGMSIEGSFQLREVVMRTVNSLAFSFDYVKELSIFGSLFDRTAMWGFKTDKCGEFNVLGGSRFYSLASQAFHLKCTKFMLAYNIFDSLQNSSISVKYHLADIQGNTFEKMSGTPFYELRPLASQDEMDNNEISSAPSGFVFRENKFTFDPALPFGGLAMPGFSEIKTDGSYVDIEANHFLCECDRIGWYLALVQDNFDSEVIRSYFGRGSLDFMKQLYETSGYCLKCSPRACEPEDETVVEFGQSALRPSAGHFVCVESGLVIKSQNDSPRVHHHGATDPEESGIHGKGNGHHHGQQHNKNDHVGKHPKNRGHHGEEEDLAELRNLELNTASKSTHNIMFALTVLAMVIFA